MKVERGKAQNKNGSNNNMNRAPLSLISSKFLRLAPHILDAGIHEYVALHHHHCMLHYSYAIYYANNILITGENHLPDTVVVGTTGPRSTWHTLPTHRTGPGVLQQRQGPESW